MAAFFAVAVAALFARAMGVKIDHDEHQFVAAGKVLASTSLIPYRDFPYFHTPVGVWTYAMLFALTDHLLLAARAFSSVCAWISLVVVFGFGWVAFKAQPPRMRLLLALEHGGATVHQSDFCVYLRQKLEPCASRAAFAARLSDPLAGRVDSARSMVFLAGC